MLCRNYYQLINKQVAGLGNAFKNNLFTKTELLKTQIYKTIKLGEFLGNLITVRPLITVSLPFICYHSFYLPFTTDLFIFNEKDRSER